MPAKAANRIVVFRFKRRAVVTGASEGIVKREDLDVLPQRVLFKDLVSGDGRDDGGKFVRFMSGGRVPKKKALPKELEITQEEIHRQRLDAIERETYTKTFASAEKAAMALGEEAMEREIARVLPQFEAVLRQLDGLPKRIFAGAERFLVETSIALTRELLAHELTVNPQGIVDRVQRILDQSSGRHEIVIYVSPGNAELLLRLGRFDQLRIEADPNVAPGSVRMESDFGGMEDNLEQQLAEVESGLRSYLQDRLISSGCEDMAEAVENTIKAETIKTPLAEDYQTDQELPVQPVPEQSREVSDAAAVDPLPEQSREAEKVSAATVDPLPEQSREVERASAATVDPLPEPSREVERASAATVDPAALAEEHVPRAPLNAAPTEAVVETVSASEFVEGDVTTDSVEAFAAEEPVEESVPTDSVEAFTAEEPAEEEGGSTDSVEAAIETSTEEDIADDALAHEGFAGADWSQGMAQPAWLSEDLSEEELSEEEVKLDNDGIS